MTSGSAVAIGFERRHSTGAAGHFDYLLASFWGSYLALLASAALWIIIT
jgi:hypothetical protein